MRTVHEVSKLTGVSIRTLHYYDRIGLLRPSDITGSGYRLYDDAALERLQHILLFRELQFPLKEIRTILDSPNFDRNKALEQQIALLEMKKEHLENLITYARGIQFIGVRTMDFKAFDTTKMDEYARQAKAQWGQTKAWQEFEQKTKGRSDDEEQKITEEFVEQFMAFGRLRHLKPEDDAVQKQVEKLQEFITAHYYTCTPKILKCLGGMYAGGGAMTENINAAAGEGTAEFTAEAIGVYCGQIEA